MNKKLLFVFSLVLFFYTHSFSQAGRLDRSFGDNGVATIPVVLLHNTEQINATKIVQLKNGKFIVAVSPLFGNNFFDTYLYRINKNGTIDSSFANNGRKIIHSGSEPFYLFDVITDSNNNIIISTGTSTSDNSGFNLTRYKPGGTKDLSFGDSGVAVVHNFNGKSGMLSLQPDGKILASGFQYPLELLKLWNSVLYRFTQNGLPDSSFNTYGYVLFENNFFGEYPQGYNYYYSATQPNNRIIYAGSAITQLNQNGTKNKKFADSGKIIGDSIYYDGAYFKELFSNIHVFDDGGFMCISVYNVYDRYGGCNATSKVYKFKSNGTPDSSFITGSEVLLTKTHTTGDFEPPPFADHLNVQPDGKFILSIGDEELYAQYHGSNVISRYLPDGTIDTSFANHGKIKKDGHVITGIVLQKDYKIVTLENILTESNPDTAYLYLYRYKNDVDTTNTLAAPDNVMAKSISSINISPNPVQNTLHITGLKANTKLSIINELGKTIAEANASSNNYNWNIQNLPAGNYFLVASQNNKVVTSIKFIKQ